VAVTDEELLARLDRGELVEGPAQASEGYLDALVRTLISVADAELRGLPFYLKGIQDAPTINAYMAGIALLQDEVGHATVAYRLLKDLGVDTDQALYRRELKDCRQPYFFDVPLESWAEFAVATGLLDRAGFHLLGDVYESTSYAPWKRALVKVHREENFHMRLGERWMTLLGETPEGREAVQRAIDWMFLMGMEFFGQPDALKKHGDQLDYRLRGHGNDELRQRWMADTVQLCLSVEYDVPARLDEEAGEYVLTCPYPLAFDDEKKRWKVEEGAVSWDQVRDRWKRRGPGAAWCLEQITMGWRELQEARV
jgi:ring-1,2-phenylacetyl-CoA epoxidase subunit PaaA